MKSVKEMKKMKKYILTGILSVLVMTGLLVTVKSSVLSANQSAHGQGKLVNEDGSRSEFSFNVHRNPDGKVVGQATLRNPSYKTTNDQNEKIKINVICLKIVGKIAVIGGWAKRQDNQAGEEAVYFAVEDGAAGADKIFRGFFFDDDALTKGDAQLCQTIEPEVLVLEPIAEGIIQVKAN